MFVILSVLVWQDAGIIRGGEALFLLLVQHDYFFLECVSLEKMYKIDKGNLRIPSQGLQNYRLQSKRWCSRNAVGSALAVTYNFSPAEFWWYWVSRTGGGMQCLGGERYNFCTNTLIINNDEKQNRKLTWHFNRILVTSDTLTKFCIWQGLQQIPFPVLMEVKQI